MLEHGTQDSLHGIVNPRHRHRGGAGRVDQRTAEEAVAGASRWRCIARLFLIKARDKRGCRAVGGAVIAHHETVEGELPLQNVV